MATTRRLERLSAADRYVLMWDNFGWSGDIGALATLDAGGLLGDDGQVRIEHVRAHIESRLHLLPRFRQRLYRPRYGLGGPLWVDAPAFDITDHIRVHPVPFPGDRQQFLQEAERLAAQRLDASRPLWQLWLLPGMPEHRMGLFVKLHHAVADGAAGVAAISALFDLSADQPTAPAAPWTPAPSPTTGQLLHDNLGQRIQQVDHVWQSLIHPGRTLRAMRSTWPTWREFFAEERAPRTSLNRPIGTQRRLVTASSPLESVKQIAHTQHAKVNDVVLTAVAGGLRAMLLGRGETVEKLTLRVMVPISLHRGDPGQAVGNQDSWIVIPLRLDQPDPTSRLRTIAAETTARKDKTHPEVGSGIFGFALAQRVFLHLFAHQRLFNVTATNVAGPPVPVYLAGAPLLELFPVVSLVANLPIAVAVLSYAGQLTLTAVGDADTCADMDTFGRGAQSAFDDLNRLLAVAG